MFDQGTGCRVNSDPNKVAPGKAVVADQNSLGVREGDKICIKTVSHIFYLEVGRTEKILDLRNKDNILIAAALGTDFGGHYRVVSDWVFFLHKAFGTKEVRWSGVVAVSETNS